LQISFNGSNPNRVLKSVAGIPGMYRVSMIRNLAEKSGDGRQGSTNNGLQRRVKNDLSLIRI
jgi:hypothetical protein